MLHAPSIAPRGAARALALAALTLLAWIEAPLHDIVAHGDRPCHEEGHACHGHGTPDAPSANPESMQASVGMPQSACGLCVLLAQHATETIDLPALAPRPAPVCAVSLAAALPISSGARLLVPARAPPQA